MNTQRDSLLKRRNARLAAVQALYQQRLNDNKQNADTLVKNILVQWEEENPLEGDWDTETPPDKSLLRKIVTYAVEHEPAIEEHIRSVLKADWKMERMSTLLLSILRAGIAELLVQPTLKAGIIVDEYVTMAGGFFDDNEQSFVNGALHTLAGRLRG